MLEEQFRELPEFPGYQISSHGNIYNKKNHKLRPYDTGKGYLMVKLKTAAGEQKQIHVHRLCAMAFIPNPDNLPEVHHADNCRSNNYIRNLSWVTRCENAKQKLVNRFFDFATQLPPMDLTRWLA